MFPASATIRGFLLGTTALLAAAPVRAQAPGAQPQGGSVVAGQASIARGASTTTVTQTTDRAAIEWQRFDVGRDQTVRFQQPGAGSWTLNRVVTPDPSVIAGRIQANGGVAIVNQSGIVFSQGAQVNVGALIASAANITNENFMAGRMRFDAAPRPGARVENHGDVTVADRGLAVFVAPGVSNTGTIRARLGRVALQGAETFALDMAGDGLLSIDVTQAVRAGGAALVTNSGTIEAPGGSVLLSAAAASGLVEDVVRNSGRISANAEGGRAGQVAIRAQGGGVVVGGVVEANAATGAAAGRVQIGGASTERLRVEGQVAARGTGAGVRGGLVTAQAKQSVVVAGGAKLDASGAGGGGTVLAGTTGIGRDQPMAARTTVEAGAALRADATDTGRGGTVVVNSAEATAMRGSLSARGGPAGGDGGFVEVSGQKALLIHGNVDVTAPAGRRGEFLIDPQNIIISDAAAPDLGGDVLDGVLTGDTALDALVGIVAATAGDADQWLRIETSAITGYAGGNITLSANRQIIVDTGFTRNAAGDLSLLAGLSGGNSGADITVRAGADIAVNGALRLDTQRGRVVLNADLRATSLTLSGRGGVSQAAGAIQHRDGAGVALPLYAASSHGDVALTRSGNGALAVTVASAADTFRLSGQAIDFAGDLRAQTAEILAAGGISQSGGTFQHNAGAGTALGLVVTSSAGDVILNRANGRLDVKTDGTSQGNWTVNSGGEIRVIGPILATGVVTLTTPSMLTVSGTITGQAITLRASDIAIDARIAAAAGIIDIGAAGGGTTIFLGGDQGGGDPAGLYLNGTEIGLLGGSGGGGADVAADRLVLRPSLGVTVIGDADFRSRFTTLEMVTDGAGIVQTGGALQTHRLVARSATGSILLEGVGNNFVEFAASTAGGAGESIRAASIGAFQVLSDTGPSGVTTGVSGAGTVALTAPGLVLHAPIATTAGGGTVSLVATGAAGIVQGTEGRISALQLTAAASTAGAPILLDAGGAAALAQINAIGRIATMTAGGDIRLVNGIALEIGGNVTAGGEVTLRAPTLSQTAGTIGSTGSGSTILLSGDSIVLAGVTPTVVAQADGAVALQPFSDDTSVTFGAAGGLVVSAAMLPRISAGTLSLRATGSGNVTVVAALDLPTMALDLRGASVGQVGRITATRIGGAAGLGDFTLADPTNVVGAARGITATNGNVTLASATPLTLGDIAAGGATLTATAPSLALDGALSAGSLGTPGTITLTAQGGGIALGAAGVTAQGATSLIRLASFGDVTQTDGGAGALVANRLELAPSGGGSPAADLRGAGNAVAQLQSTMPLGFALHNTTALAVVGSGIASPGGPVSLRAASIALNAPIQAGAFGVSLAATGAGGITQIAGAPITAGRLSLASGGAALLDGGGVDRNAVATLGDVTVTGDAVLRNDAALTLEGAISADGAAARMGTLTLDALGAIIQTAGTIRADAVVFTTDAAPTSHVALAQPGNDVGGFAGTAGGVAVLATAGATTLGGTAARSVTLTAGDALSITGDVTATAGGITLSGTGIALGASLDAGAQGVSLTASGAAGITQSAGRLRAAALGISAAAGSAVLDNGDASLVAGLNEVGTLNAATVQGVFTLRNQGSLAVATVIGAGAGLPNTSVTLHAQAGDIAFSGAGGVRTDALALTARAGTVTLPGAIATANGISIDAGAISLGGGLSNATAGGIELRSQGAIALGGAVAAPGQRVTLLSDGNVSQAAGGITAAEFVVRGIAPGTATTGIALGGDNAIGSVLEMRSSGDIRLRSSGALSIDGVVLAGADGVVRLETDGLLTVAATGSVAAGDPALAEAGQVTLWGFGIQLSGPVQAGDAVTLFAAGGAMDFAGLPLATVPGATIGQAPAGAPIITRRLTTVAPNTVDLGAAGNVVDEVAHFGLAGNDVAFVSDRPLTIGTSPVFLSPSNNVAQIGGIQGSNGAVSLRAPSLAIAQPVVAGEGSQVSLTTDALSIAALVSAPGGTVRLAPITPGLDYALGTAAVSAPGLIALSVAEVANIRSGTLSIAGDGEVTLGALDLRTAGVATRVARVLDVTGANVIQAPGAELSVERFTASAAGNVLLDQGGAPTATGNTINSLGPVTATAGDIGITAGGVPDGAGGRRAPAVDGAGNPIAGTQPLALAGALTAGGTIALRTDGLALAGGSMAAAAGAISIGTFSAGHRMVIGQPDAGPGALALETGLATALDFGAGPGRSLTLLAAGGDVHAAGFFDLGGASGADLLSIHAGSVSSSPIFHSEFTVARIEMSTTLGGADLSGGSHLVDEVRIVAAGGPTGLTTIRDLSVLGVATAADGRVGRVTLHGRSLTLDGAVRGDVVNLSASADGGAITQAAPLDAGRLAVSTNNGAVTLARADNRIDHLAFAEALGSPGASLTLATANPLSLDRDGGAGIRSGSIDITAPSIGPAVPGGPQDVFLAGDQVTLRATVGGIELGAGSQLIGGASLRVLAQGDIDAAGTSLGATGEFLAQAGGAATLVDGFVHARTVTMAAGTDLRLDRISIGAGDLAGGDIDLVARGGGVTMSGAPGATHATTTGAFAISAGGAIDIADYVLAGTSLAVTASGSIGLARGSLAAGAGALLVSSLGGTLSVAGTRLSADPGALHAPAPVTLAGLGGVALTRTTITGDALRIRSDAGGIAMDGAFSLTGQSVSVAASGDVAMSDGSVTTPGRFVVTAGANAALDGVQAGAVGGIDITAGAGGAIARSVLLAPRVALVAQSGLTLAASVVVAGDPPPGVPPGPPGFTASAGPAGALAVSDSRITASVTSLSGGAGMTIAGTVIDTGAGGLTASSGGALRLLGTRMGGQGASFLAGGEVEVTNTAIGVQRDLAFATTGGGFTIAGSILEAGGTLAFAGAGASSIGSSDVVAETALFRTTGSLTVGSVRARIGSLIVFGAPGGIAADGVLRVSPAFPESRFPAVVYDTRASAATSPLPLTIQPDRPGLAPEAQPTQLRTARAQAPGSLGLASDGAAGPLRFDVVAPDSAVFLLADSAAIRGRIEAARLGVHGTGGDATIDGLLAGRAGIATAQFAEVTRPVVPGALQRYRINGCVLSSVNCVVLPPVLVVPSRLAADVVVALDRQRVRNPDVVVPDVAQEDY